MTAPAWTRVPSSSTTPVARRSSAPAGFSARMRSTRVPVLHGDVVLQLLTHAREALVGPLGPHVAHRRRDQRHAVQQGLAADAVGLLAAAVDLRRRAVLLPDAVDVLDELGQVRARDEPVQPAADVGREGELAVAEGAGAAPAAGDVARFAAAAHAGGARRAAAAGDVGAALHEQHVEPVAAHELERGEDAGRACAHDDDVVGGAGSVHGDGAGRVGNRTESSSLSGMIDAPPACDKRSAAGRSAPDRRERKRSARRLEHGVATRWGPRRRRRGRRS